jgi:hypothetical protein
MLLYNEATGAYADQPAKALHVWADLGWVPVQPVIEAEAEEQETAEVTAEDTGRRRHPSAKATKDK